VSYLVTGQPGFELNAQKSEVLAQFIGPTLSAFAANNLRQFVGPWVDAFRFELGSGTQQQTGQTSSNVGQYIYGATVGVEKQVADKMFLSLNTGLCQLDPQFTQTNLLAGVGAKVEYRFKPELRRRSRSIRRRPRGPARGAEHHRCGAPAAEPQLLAAPHLPLLIKSAIVIANPASRRGRRLAGHAQRALTDRSIDCDLVFTERPGHAAELAASHAHAYDAVFVVGGDGTVMEVAAALASHASETPSEFWPAATWSLAPLGYRFGVVGVPGSRGRRAPSGPRSARWGGRVFRRRRGGDRRRDDR
jgi:hypothetical protein